ncbi:hypothetical protein A9Q83_11230 [Alphaproteobacteria bacterium 46_93_T64]|nr:hypothetical protein A9Q83_11230 [Alphaproteobacteria bacterium 46_93_T64]
MKNLLLFLFLFSISSTAAADNTTRVFVSIAPLHSLVQGVMGDTGEAKLLIKASVSPHGFQLKPSQMRALKTAHIIFSIGPSFETSLHKAVSALSLADNVTHLIDAKGVELLESRSGGAWDDHDKAHSHEHEGEAIEHNGNLDPHIWLDPFNGIAMVNTIATELARIYPENEGEFYANADKLIGKIKLLNENIAVKLTPVNSQPYIVFHDAFQYFETHYGMKAVGGIVVDPSRNPSIARMKEIRAQIKTTKAICAFREPQFSGKLVDVALDGSSAKPGVLDPIGQAIPLGPDLYLQMLTQMADQMLSCLKQQQ